MLPQSYVYQYQQYIYKLSLPISVSPTHQFGIILVFACLLLLKILQVARQLIQNMHECMLQIHGLNQWLHILQQCIVSMSECAKKINYTRHIISGADGYTTKGVI